jgi:aspartyl-tRNA(Asn)/glutamyl-tRNA(Gln) amidotransferase subunit B
MITVPMRAKELEEDYRYIPDPDLFPIRIGEDRVEEIRKRLPEAPHLRFKRIVVQYGISEEAADVIVSERELADLFERVARHVNPQLAATWFRTRLKKILNYHGMRASDIRFSPEQLVELLQLVERKEITPEQGELVLRELVVRPAPPRELLEKLGLKPLEVSDLEKLVAGVIEQNAEAVRDYVSGRKEALNFLIGQVLRASRGKADPRAVKRLLEEKLGAEHQ